MPKEAGVPENVSKRMRAIRGKDTRAEQLLRHALRTAGIRYRTYVSLPGKPDIVVVGAKIAVFVDGDFWHGRNWRLLRLKLDARWRKKILSNRARDRRVSRALQSAGWTVLRLWETDIHEDVNGCVAHISQTIERFEAACSNPARKH